MYSSWFSRSPSSSLAINWLIKSSAGYRRFSATSCAVYSPKALILSRTSLIQPSSSQGISCWQQRHAMSRIRGRLELCSSIAEMSWLPRVRNLSYLLNRIGIYLISSNSDPLGFGPGLGYGNNSLSRTVRPYSFLNTTCSLVN